MMFPSINISRRSGFWSLITTVTLMRSKALDFKLKGVEGTPVELIMQGVLWYPKLYASI